MKIFGSLLMAGLFLSFAGSSTAHAVFTVVEKDDWKFQFGGFIESDSFYDSTRSFGEVPGNVAISRQGTFPGDAGRMTFSVRNSRVNFTLTPPLFDDWKSRALIEFDFLNGNPTSTTESATFSAPSPRLRHGFLQIERFGLSILVGQFWSFLGWQPVYFLQTAYSQPVAGMLFDRTPQLTVIHTAKLVPEKFELQSGISLERPAQRDSSIPNIDAGLRFSIPAIKSGLASGNSDVKLLPASIAFSGSLRGIEAPASAGDTQNRNLQAGWAAAVDLMAPILWSMDGISAGNTITLSGEFSIGQGFGEEFSGYTGNLSALASPGTGSKDPNLDPGLADYDNAGNFTMVQLRSFNLQLQYHAPESWKTYFTLGYGQLGSPNLGAFTNLATGAYLRSASTYLYDRSETIFLSALHNFTPQIRVGLEGDRAWTHYTDGNQSSDTRLQLVGYFLF